MKLLKNEKEFKAYQEILKVLDKNSEVISGDYQIDIVDRIKSRIELCRISDLFEIEIKNKDSSTVWVEISNHEHLHFMSKESGRYISWSDNGEQPEKEWLYQISFPTGAYIFGQDYPKETFNKFFNKLKSFSPKYSDTANKCLYFTPDKAKDIHKQFPFLFEEFKSKVSDELKERRREELKKELKLLDEKI